MIEAIVAGSSVSPYNTAACMMSWLLFQGQGMASTMNFHMGMNMDMNMPTQFPAMQSMVSIARFCQALPLEWCNYT